MKKEVNGMSIYWVMSYYIVADKATKFQKWMKSDRAKELAAEFEKETGIKYIDTYFPILGFGKYDCEDWYLVPDFSAFDKIRASKAFNDMNIETWEFMDETKLMVSRLMRTAEDVLITEPPKKEE
jgi:hypothetical protein